MEADLYAVVRSIRLSTSTNLQALSTYPIPVATLRLLFSASFVGPFAVSRTFGPSVSFNVTSNRATCWSTPTELKICSCLAQGYSPEGCAKPMGSDRGFMIEHAATWWYRAPEVMMSFANYVSLPQLINCLPMLMFWNA